ncbi:MAG: hypothetical protein ACRC35_04020 [Angustibacter sp.]
MSIRFAPSDSPSARVTGLRAGHSLVRHPGGWAVRLPDGSFQDIQAPVDDVAQLVPWLSGRRPAPAAEHMSRLVRAFRDADYVVEGRDGPVGPQPDEPSPVVHLHPDTLLAGPIRQALTGHAPAGDADPWQPGDLVLHLGDEPTFRGPAARHELDLPARGVWWLGGHLESGRVLFGPTRRRPEDPTSLDVHRRRLAASRTPDHVRAAAAPVVAGPGELDSAGAAVVVGLVAALVREVLDENAGTSSTATDGAAGWPLLTVLGLDPVQLTRHVVLPVPDVEPARAR